MFSGQQDKPSGIKSKDSQIFQRISFNTEFKILNFKKIYFCFEYDLNVIYFSVIKV